MAKGGRSMDTNSIHVFIIETILLMQLEDRWAFFNCSQHAAFRGNVCEPVIDPEIRRCENASFGPS